MMKRTPLYSAFVAVLAGATALGAVTVQQRGAIATQPGIAAAAEAFLATLSESGRSTGVKNHSNLAWSSSGRSAFARPDSLRVARNASAAAAMPG